MSNNEDNNELLINENDDDDVFETEVKPSKEEIIDESKFKKKTGKK